MKKPSLFVLIDIKEKFPLIQAPDSPKAFWYHKRGTGKVMSKFFSAGEKIL